MEMFDLIIDSDLQTDGGDFVVSESTAQHEKLLIESNKGEWRQYPLCGVGIARYINDETPGSLITAIKTELKNDGMNVNGVSISPDTGNIEIDAYYE
jgi:hypothetical protein